MSIDWRKVQKGIGVSVDGIAGPNTWRALLRYVAASAGSPDQGVLNSLATAAIVHFPAYGITDTPERLADFLAQTCNETGGYTRFTENLNYSAARMCAIWPSHFTPAQAAAAVGHPDEIASRAYGGRMGNAPYPSPDGYTFRGRGMLQLTGKDNYTATNKRLGIGLDTNPEMAAVPAISLLIACDFYRQNKVLDAIDAGNTTKARQITNGGVIGLENVNVLRNKALAVMK